MPEMENIWVTCNTSDQLLNSDEKPFRYLVARDQLKKISNPFSQVVKFPNALKLAVDNVIESLNLAELNLHRKMLVESDVSWILILLCAASAMLGIGLKWAKVIFEFQKATAK